MSAVRAKLQQVQILLGPAEPVTSQTRLPLEQQKAKGTGLLQLQVQLQAEHCLRRPQMWAPEASWQLRIVLLPALQHSLIGQLLLSHS